MCLKKCMYMQVSDTAESITMAFKLRIAMLNADTPLPTVQSRWKTYGKMFEDLLVSAGSRSCPDLAVECTEYDVQKFEYPSSLADVDVILVTGSAASSYDAEEWITRLNDYVLDVYTNHRHVRMFGSCFGHQLICQSLLREYGVRVEKDPNGYELGVKVVQLEDKFRKTIAGGKVFLKDVPESFRVQMIHGDHVVIPDAGKLPKSWLPVGATQHCAVQGIYEPARILTFQGHFEFNRFVNMELIKHFGEHWDAQMVQNGRAAADADDDAQFAAELVLQFMLEEERSQDMVC